MKTHADSLTSLLRSRFRTLRLLTSAVLLVATAFPSISHAGLIFSFSEVNGDVVMQASGSMDTTLLTPVEVAGWGGTGIYAGEPNMVGTDETNALNVAFAFSPGTDFSQWSSVAGPFTQSEFSWDTITGTTNFATYVSILGSYQPGLAVNSAQIIGGVWTPDNSWTKLGSTFSSLGMRPGTYTVTDIVTGASIIIAVGSMGPPPEQLSATTTGLPMANAEGQAVMSGSQTVTGDINNHLFNLRSGGGEEDSDGSIAASLDVGVVVGEGDGPESPVGKLVKRTRQWEAFATMNYGNVKLSPISNQAGVQVDSWASGAGIERHISRGLTLGFALSFLQSQQHYTGGLGSVKLEGPALSAYVAYARRNVWASLLYSFGAYSMDTTRNPGFGFPQAKGDTDTYTNSVQFNTGYNFRLQNNTLVTGPFAGIDYLHGTVDSYSEAGGGLAALAYGKQSFQSLVTRVGWSASKKFDTSWASITPQVRLSYERQNLKNNGTSVSLINAPFTAAGGSQTPGQDYLVVGTGVNFQITPEFNVLFSYQTQIFRNNMEAHFGSVRLGYKF